MSAQDFTCTEGGVLLPPLDINQPHTFLSVLYGLSLLWVRRALLTTMRAYRRRRRRRRRPGHALLTS